MKNLFRAFCLTVLLNALFSQNVSAQLKYNRVAADSGVAVSEKLSPEAERRLETFRLVWQTVKDNYFDQTFGGLNWNKIKTEFEPRVLKSQTDAELHLILQEMINRLNKSHFVIIPPEVFREIGKVKAEIEEKTETGEIETETDETAPVEEEPAKPARYGIGIDIRFIDNQVVITQIEKDSPAARAGLKTGYVIEKINGVSLKSFLEKFRQNTVYAKVYEKQLSALLLTFIDGEAEGAVKIGFREEKEQAREIEIQRAGMKGEFVRILSGLPAQFITFDAKSLDEETGYIKFNIFALKTVEKFCGAISRFKNKKAIIVDMRGNIGGNFGALFGIVSLLTDKSLIIGTEINRNGKEPRFVQPQIKNFKGRLVVLTDAQSYSAAEVFASGLKENNRATLVGETTAGSALPALTMALPTGAVFLYPVGNFETPKGNLLEGRGVEPNVKIALDRASLLAGKDVQLEAAINFIKDEIKKNPPSENVSNNAPPAFQKPLILGSVTVAVPSGVKAVKDEKALKIIDEYIETIGGRENLKKLNSLAANGKVEMKQAGATVEGEAEIYRKFPNKTAKILRIESLGEIREVFDGAKSFIQTDFMGTQRNEVFAGELNLAANFRELLDAREIYQSITFESAFENEGRKINLVKAITKQGTSVYFAFDAASKLLISRAGTSVSAYYGDYRKVGEWLFPFQITEGIVTYKLKEIKPNAPVDDSRFVETESCFTKID
ncbi:MAG TPA: S41 family peptidase [Pyrinomonadaceae bacterium]